MVQRSRSLGPQTALGLLGVLGFEHFLLSLGVHSHSFSVLVPSLSSPQCSAPFPSLVQAVSRASAPSLPSSDFFQKEQEKSDKVSKRVSAVEEVRSHVKVLQEMLSMYRRPGQAPPDQEALQVLFLKNKINKFKYNILSITHVLEIAHI